MSRKIYYEGEVVVLVPVQVKVSLTVRADEGADLADALKRFQGNADLEDVSVESIVNINGYEDTDDLEAAVQESLDGGFKILKMEVIDSK